MVLQERFINESAFLQTLLSTFKVLIKFPMFNLALERKLEYTVNLEFYSLRTL